MAIEKSISEILTSIDKGEYTIPEFQRGYVWKPTQVKEFIRSLYLKYPTGSFLIWKTETPSLLRGDVQETNSIYKHLILDGQQRLTTIYTILKGETPSWYEGETLRTDLYFNLDSEEFSYYKQREMSNKKEWINVSEFFQNGGLSNFLTHVDSLEESVKNYYHNQIQKIIKLDDISKYGYYIKEVHEANLEKIVEIFNLVNSKGTTLNESDLAMAIVTSAWPEVKTEFRQVQQEYEKYSYNFAFGFFIRAMNVVACERGKFSDIKKQGVEKLKNAWDTVNKSLHYLINVFRDTAYVDSLDNFSTVYVLFTLIYYLSKNNRKFPSEADTRKAIYWSFLAQLWGRYSGSSESILERDINSLKTEGTIDALINNLKIHRGANLELSPEDFELQGTKSRIYNIFYAAIRAQNAKD